MIVDNKSLQRQPVYIVNRTSSNSIPRSTSGSYVKDLYLLCKSGEFPISGKVFSNSELICELTSENIVLKLSDSGCDLYQITLFADYAPNLILPLDKLVRIEFTYNVEEGDVYFYTLHSRDKVNEFVDIALCEPLKKLQKLHVQKCNSIYKVDKYVYKTGFATTRAEHLNYLNRVLLIVKKNIIPFECTIFTNGNKLESFSKSGISLLQRDDSYELHSSEYDIYNLEFLDNPIIIRDIIDSLEFEILFYNDTEDQRACMVFESIAESNDVSTKFVIKNGNLKMGRVSIKTYLSSL